MTKHTGRALGGKENFVKNIEEQAASLLQQKNFLDAR
jgi:hypothetical protein